MELYRPGRGKFSAKNVHKEEDGGEEAKDVPSENASKRGSGGGSKRGSGTRVFYNRGRGAQKHNENVGGGNDPGGEQ